MEIFIYSLERTNVMISGDRTKCIVAAKDEKSARNIANEDSKAEGFVWNDSYETTCRLLGTADEGVSGVLLWSIED